ncbi:hypothetical protein PUR56_04575, partial [Streptomyces sp. BE303]|nr:hypothetical protein [Streptomyces sp. BE303]
RHLVEGVREHRERLVQAPAHRRSLRTLPREQERHPTRTRNTRQTTRHGSYRAQPGSQPLGVTGEHHRPMGQRGTAGCRCGERVEIPIGHKSHLLCLGTERRL